MAHIETVKQEIERLRQIKQDVFEHQNSMKDMMASDICLSADTLLVPLYWYVKRHFQNSTQQLDIEKYLTDGISYEKDDMSDYIRRIYNRTKDLDTLFPTQPFKTYRKVMQDCFPEIINNFANDSKQ